MQQGIITRLAVQSGQPGRIAVYLDGVFAFAVPETGVQTWDLRVGQTLSVTAQERIIATEQVQAAQATALQYLAARPRTAHEVQQKLRRSGVPEAVVEQVMARLQTRGVLDDAAYARAYLTSRLSNRGYGPQRLRRELQQRGVGRALVEAAVQHDLAAEDVLAAARAQAAKRWPRLAGAAEPRKSRQKLHDFLRRRGFPAAVVQQVLTEVEQGTGTGEAG